MTRAAVLGAGSWGTTFAKVLADAGTRGRCCWARRPERGRGDPRAATRTPTTCPASGCPRRYARPRDAGRGARRRRPRRARRAVADAAGQPGRLGAAHPARTRRCVSLMKGIELGTTKRMSEVIVRGRRGRPRTGSPSSPGPTWPGRSPPSSPPRRSSPAPTPTGRQRCRRPATPPYFRPYTNTDVVGCELGGAVKNVIALAVGMADGHGLRRQHPRLADHPRAGRDRPAGRGAGRGPADVRRAGRARRPGRDLHARRCRATAPSARSSAGA